MRGYGSPSNGVAERAFEKDTAIGYDWGYGDPSTGVVTPPKIDWGYGDRKPDRFFAVLSAPGQLVPDSGGILLTLRSGSWPSHDAIRMHSRSGPFLVRVKDSATAEVYPKDMFGCHAGRIGHEWKCYTDLRHEALSFVLPPLPPAQYDIEVRHGGAGFPNLIVIPKAFEVVYRTRSANTYNARKVFPTRFATGARIPSLEILVGEE